ncbi:MAG: alpha/beta hydrolase [Pseudomonadota bacterium]
MNLLSMDPGQRIARTGKTTLAALYQAIALCIGLLLSASGQARIVGLETFALNDERALEVEVGELPVLENRGNPDSRRIKVGFFRVKSARDDSSVPTFILPGGPGGSYTERLEEPGRGRDATVELIDLYRQRGDVVLVDLRGVSRSTPNAVCEGAPNKWRLINEKSDFMDVLAAGALACRKKLLDEGFDIRGYNVLEAAADVIEIADSLGYEQIRLHGTSFGSHWSMTVMRYHSDRVARAVISGVESYDHTYDDPEGLRAAASMISAMASTAWQEAGREGDPLTHIDALLKRSLEDPELAHGLEPYLVSTLALGGQDFGLTSRARMPGWPDAAADLVDGSIWLEKTFVRFLGARFAVPSGWDAAAVGLFDCSSGLSEERRARLNAHADPLFTPAALEFYDTICPAWDVPPLSKEFRAGAIVDVPVLFVHGDIDFATPLSNAEENMSLYPQGHLVVVGNGSHGAFLESLRMDSQMESLVLDWIDGTAPSRDYVQLPPVEFESFD